VGPLKLPDTGCIYFDANALIYSVENIEPFWSMLQPAWRAARAGQIEIISSELVFLEISVKPIREHDDLLTQTYRDLLLNSRDVCLIPIDLAVIEAAAQIRAVTRLKSPDAIHAATAIDADVALFITNDPLFHRVSGLKVAVLSESSVA
jgi:predicted nucleic acid-binding protein